MATERAVKGPSRARRDERWLSDVWGRQAFDRRRLRTTSGLEFKVVFPGLCLGEAGPDFRDAILAVDDGSLLRGDVELHLESSGWRQHGHHQDALYDRVLLHVVLEDDQPAFNSSGRPVLTLELAGRIGPRAAPVIDEPPADEGLPSAQLSYVVAPCQRTLPRVGLDRVRDTIIELATERFQAKQTLFEGELAVYEPEQVLYGGLIEALGYSRNREPFRRLAQLVPPAALHCAKDATQIEAMLLAGAGLVESANAVLAQAGLSGETLPADAWRTIGVRPENLPPKRIQQVACVLERLLAGGLLDELLAPLLELGMADVDGKAAQRLRHTWHIRLAELGTQRSDAIAVNVLLPFAAAYGQATCQFMLSELAAQAFLHYPSEGANQVTRYMRRDLLGPLAKAANGAAGEQGLLHVWDHWCREKVCALCPLSRPRQ